MLKRIRVKNFKSLKYLDYPCAKLNLLMGVNGAGKSSFIQFLLFLRDFSKRDLEAYVSVREESEVFPVKFDDVVYCYAKKPEIQFKIEFCNRPPRGCNILNFEGNNGRPMISVPVSKLSNPASEAAMYELANYKFRVESISRYIYKDRGVNIVDPAYSAEVCASQQYKDLQEFEKMHGCGELIDPENAPELYAQYIVLAEAVNKYAEKIASQINDAEEKNSKDFKELWDHMRFVEAFRDKPQEIHIGNSNTSGAFWVCDLLLEGGDVIEYLYNVGEELELPEGNLMISPNCLDKRRLIDQVNAWLQVVSPGAQIKISKRVIEGAGKFIQSVAFGRARYGHAFKPQSVGFGISYVLPVLVALLTAQPNDIVIIENPEAHLHPRGQAEMGNLIARAAAYGVQVFVETHSDHVINGVRVAVKKGIVKPDDVNIAFFERKGHEAEDGSKHKEYYADVRNIKIDANGSLSEYPEDFMDEWSNQLMRLMRPRTK
jgi:predicted ATPase